MPQKQSVKTGKTSRHKKRKPRTEASSSESSENDSEPTNSSQVGDEVKADKRREDSKICVNRKKISKSTTDDEFSAAFAEFYLKKVTNEFSDDLDQLRNADDFKEDSIPILINALQQGTSLFSIEEQRRIMMADQETDEK